MTHPAARPRPDAAVNTGSNRSRSLASAIISDKVTNHDMRAENEVIELTAANRAGKESSHLTFNACEIR